MINLFVIFLLPVFLAHAEESGPPKVGRIEIQRLDVFDTSKPGEDRPPYTLVNKLHFVTRDSVIRRELLLEPGDTFDHYLLENSERNLRSYRFLKDADIEAKPQLDTTVDLTVKVQDTWTTDIAPTIGVGAGERKFGLLSREHNFLGRGKTLIINYIDNSGVTAREIGYKDPRILGSRFALKVNHNDSSRGYDTDGFIGLPVYSLVTPLSLGIKGRHGSAFKPIYSRGDETARIKENFQKYEMMIGHPLTASSRRAVRATYGYAAVDNRFVSSITAAGFGLPENRKFRMPSITVNYQESDYVKENLVNRFERVEDFNLGWEAGLRLAYSAEAFGSAQDEILPRFELSKGIGLGAGRLFLAGAQAYFIYDGSKARQVVQAICANYYHKRFFYPKNTLVLHAESSTGMRLASDSQLLMGGNSGLRGYRFNYFGGNKSLLFNAETRFYWLEDWLYVVSVAPVAFWDAGYVWPEGKKRRLGDFKHDAGFGLRLGFTRSASAPVVRLDLSYALNKEGTVKSGWVFSAGINHAFDPSGNSLHRVDRE
ncbi:MAG: BamA/TamA family outer membrane protein [Elusimicrobia bacterium]|nr:BamA/TamA family outer membrane protein [Elusimicrobiota bacterium]